MRGTVDGGVQSVRKVPPIVKAGRGQHHDSAPSRYESSQRPMKSQDSDRDRPLCRGVAEGRGEDHVSAGDASQDPAHVDEHMRWDPKGVMANRLMPGQIPGYSAVETGNRNNYTHQGPRHRGRQTRPVYILPRNTMIEGNRTCHDGNSTACGVSIITQMGAVSVPGLPSTVSYSRRWEMRSDRRTAIRGQRRVATFNLGAVIMRPPKSPHHLVDITIKC